MLREVLWSFSRLDRVASCGRRRIDGSLPVGVSTAEGVAHYTNLAKCGSIHSCPVCAAKIRQERAEEIERGVMAHLSRGGGVYFLTLTLPHHAGDRLSHLLETVALAFRRVLGGRGWQRDRELHGIVGTIRALEATVGPNGWHPHLHVLLFTSSPLDAAAQEALRLAIYGRWAATVEGRGYGRPEPFLCPMSPVRGAGDVGRYLTKIVDQETERKVGLEMARHDLKEGRSGAGRSAKHRTPFQLLADFATTGDVDDLDLWHEWEEHSKGRQAITWSRGLKELLGVGERTDEEIAEEEIGGEQVLQIQPDRWAAITATPGAADRVLRLVETEGAEAAERFIEDAYREHRRRRRSLD